MSRFSSKRPEWLTGLNIAWGVLLTIVATIVLHMLKQKAASYPATGAFIGISAMVMGGILFGLCFYLAQMFFEFATMCKIGIGMLVAYASVFMFVNHADHERTAIVVRHDDVCTKKSFHVGPFWQIRRAATHGIARGNGWAVTFSVPRHVEALSCNFFEDPHGIAERMAASLAAHENGKEAFDACRRGWFGFGLPPNSVTCKFAFEHVPAPPAPPRA